MSSLRFFLVVLAACGLMVCVGCGGKKPAKQKPKPKPKVVQDMNIQIQSDVDDSTGSKKVVD